MRDSLALTQGYLGGQFVDLPVFLGVNGGEIPFVHSNGMGGLSSSSRQDDLVGDPYLLPVSSADAFENGFLFVPLDVPQSVHLGILADTWAEPVNLVCVDPDSNYSDVTLNNFPYETFESLTSDTTSLSFKKEADSTQATEDREHEIGIAETYAFISNLAATSLIRLGAGLFGMSPAVVDYLLPFGGVVAEKGGFILRGKQLADQTETQELFQAELSKDDIFRLYEFDAELRKYSYEFSVRFRVWIELQNKTAKGRETLFILNNFLDTMHADIFHDGVHLTLTPMALWLFHCFVPLSEGFVSGGADVLLNFVMVMFAVRPALMLEQKFTVKQGLAALALVSGASLASGILL